jgi:multidrug efflux pump subunit AcrA (membrane-fusion protein)
VKTKFINGVLPLLLLVSAFSCRNKAVSEAEKRVPISVRTALVEQRNINEYHTFNGVTKYQKTENIRANVTGYISWMPFEMGSAIKRGQTFATVRTKEQDAMEEAAKIDSSLAKFSKPIRIVANSTGVITTLSFFRNDYISEGDILATIVQPKSLVVQVNVPYEFAESIHIGTSCEIILPDKETITAKITQVLPLIDPIAQSQSFLIELPNRDLPENLNVTVKVIDKKSTRTMAVPKEAIQTNELLTDFWVMKVVNDTLAIKEKVIPMLRNDSLVQISSPNVNLHDTVITQGGYEMQDSTLVKVQLP